MAKHAILSASSSYRWMNCPPSAKLCISSDDKASEYAQQGTDAHSLCQYKLESALGRKIKNPVEDLSFYDAEMEGSSEGYTSFIMELVEKAKSDCADPLVLVEQRLDFSRFVPDGFGTGDCVIASDKTLAICDLKYGKGLLVEAENNPQLMCYALGALEMFDGIYDIDNVSMTIYQPRRENISTFVLSKEKLLEWAENVLVPAARQAFEGTGEFKAGDHCRFCKIKATCRKRAEYSLELAKYDFSMPATLEDDEIENILSKAEGLVSWANDIKEFALKAAISGKEWTGWKVVEGRSNRKYTDEDAVAKAVKESGFNPYEQKLMGIMLSGTLI